MLNEHPDVFHNPGDRHSNVTEEGWERSVEFSTQTHGLLQASRIPRADNDAYDDHASRGTGRKYNEYFVSGNGIDREVFQHDIAHSLGNDATCIPFHHLDGHYGFAVRAYRKLTTAMLEDLKRDSALWREEKMAMMISGLRVVSYAETKNRRYSAYILAHEGSMS